MMRWGQDLPAMLQCKVRRAVLILADRCQRRPSTVFSRMARSNCSAKGRFVPLIISTEGLVGLDKLL